MPADRCVGGPVRRTPPGSGLAEPLTANGFDQKRIDDRVGEFFSTRPGPARPLSEVQAELDALVGLETVKEQVRALVAFLQETNTLEPGDLILTGTPSGVGAAMDPRTFLADGDVIRIEISSLGAIEHPIA